tara:strand:+ start:4651 stop:4815 length:165 start_codon:yes stop_codon:yes gene_type:complete
MGELIGLGNSGKFKAGFSGGPATSANTLTINTTVVKANNAAKAVKIPPLIFVVA